MTLIFGSIAGGALFLLASVACGQKFTGEVTPTYHGIGVRAGVDIGTMSFDIGPSEPDWKTGLALGAQYDIWYSDNVAISVQPSYVEKGFIQTFQQFEPANELTVTATFAYFQIPVLLLVTTDRGGFRPYAFAGPSLGLKLSTTETVTSEGKDSTSEIDDNSIFVGSLSFTAGLGLFYEAGQKALFFLEAAYDLGLSNVNSSRSSPQFKAYYRDVRIQSGVLFLFGAL